MGSMLLVFFKFQCCVFVLFVCLFFVFFLFFFFFSGLFCFVFILCLWTVHSWLSLWYSLALMSWLFVITGFCLILIIFRRRRGRDRMIFGFTATCAISAYHHLSCALESRWWRGVLDTTLWAGFFSPCTPASSNN